MKLRHLLMSYGLFAIAWGLFVILAPQRAAGIDVGGVEGEFLSHIGQSRAPTVVAFGVMAWVARDLAESPALKVILFGLALTNLLMALVIALSQFTAAATPMGWPLVVLHGLWGIGFAAFLFGQPRRSAP